MSRSRISSEHLAGRFAALYKEEWKHPDEEETYIREIIRMDDAVGVLAENTEGQVIMISQFREAVEMEVFEIPAGKIDKGGETPLEVAKRELKEETGLTAEKWEVIREDTIPSPGAVSERISLYYATELTQGDTALEEDEEIEPHWLSLDEAIERTQDMKSLVALLWLKSKRQDKALGQS